MCCSLRVCGRARLRSPDYSQIGVFECVTVSGSWQWTMPEWMGFHPVKNVPLLLFVLVLSDTCSLCQPFQCLYVSFPLVCPHFM